MAARISTPPVTTKVMPAGRPSRPRPLVITEMSERADGRVHEAAAAAEEADAADDGRGDAGQHDVAAGEDCRRTPTWLTREQARDDREASSR